MTAEELKMIYGVDVIAPEFDSVKDSDGDTLKSDESSYDIWTVLYDGISITGDAKGISWEDFYFKMPLHRIEMLWSLQQERLAKSVKEDGFPLNMNHLALQIILSKVLGIFASK